MLGIHNGRHVAEHVPHDFKMVVHFAAAAHHIAFARNIGAVQGATRQRVLFEYVDMLARDLRVAHEIERGRQRGQTRADNIGLLVFHALRFLWMGERFIISSRIIHGVSLIGMNTTIVGRQGWANA